MQSLLSRRRTTPAPDRRQPAGAAWIRLHGPDVERDELSWSTPRGGGGRGTLAQAAEACRGRLVDVIVPGESVLLAGAPMPKAGPRQLREAFPYALEDSLAEDVEHLHFALAPTPRRRVAGEPVYGAVVERALVEQWLDRLREAGLRIGRLVPDTLCLPWAEAVDGADEAPEPEPWVLWLGRERFVLRTARFAGLAGERSLLEAVLAAGSVGGAGEPHRLEVYTGEDVGSEAVAALQERAGVLRVEPGSAQGEAGAFCADRAGGLDLMQGPYRPDTPQAGGPRVWRWPAVLLWVLVLAQLASVGVEHSRLAERHAALQQGITALYRRSFPADHRIVNARVQMAQHLAALRAGGQSGDHFVELLAALGNAVRAEPGLRVDAVSYKGGRLGVRLSAPRVALVQALRDRLGRDGRLATHIESIDAGGHDQGEQAGRTRVRLSVEESGT